MITGSKIRLLAACFLAAAVCAPNMPASPEATRRLAVELSQEERHAAAAVEFRRLALGATADRDRAGYYFAAAHAYLEEGDFASVGRMLDRVEEAWQGIEKEVLLLRAEAALRGRHAEEADFYLKGLEPDASYPAWRRFLDRRRAQVDVLRGRTDAAQNRLQDGPAARAVKKYASSARKSPRVGGLLGLLPGLGFVYSGEYDNAVRSLLLNGLFIYAMADTAGDEHWGAFAAVSFFELTWYTGSIYGGVDAAHRYNRRLLEDCLDTIDGGAGFAPDLNRIPAVALRFEF